MPDKETTIRITGEDNTSKAVNSAKANFSNMAKSVQKDYEQLDNGLMLNLRALRHRATETHKSYDKLYKVAKEAALGQRDFVEKIKEGGKAADEAGKKTEKAGKKGTGAFKEFYKHLSPTNRALADMAMKALKVGTAMELMRRGFSEWAEVDNQLRLVQNSTGATRVEVDDLAESLRNVGNVTGDSFDKSISAFNTLRESAQLTNEQTKKILPDLALAAKGMGAPLESVARAVGTIRRNFKIGLEDVPSIYEGMSYATEKLGVDVSKIGPEIAQVTEMMSALGYEGRDANDRLLAYVGTLNQATGDTTQSMALLSRMLGNMGNEQMAKALGFADARQFKEDLEASGDVIGRMVRLMSEATDQYAVREALGIREIGAWNKLKSVMGSMEGNVRGVHNATGALAKGLNITEGPLVSLQRLKNTVDDLTVSLGHMFDALGANAALKWFIDRMEEAVRGAERLVSLINWALPGGKRPDWVKSPKEMWYTLNAYKDERGNPITTYAEAEAGADVEEDKRKYDAKRKAKEDKKEEEDNLKDDARHYNAKANEYIRIRRDRPTLRPIAPDIPESVKKKYPNLKPGEVTPDTEPSGTSSVGGTTTIQTGPATGAPTGSPRPDDGLGLDPDLVHPSSYSPDIMETPHGRRLNASMGRAAATLASVSNNIPGEKGAAIRNGLIHLASFNPAIDSGLRRQKAGRDEGTGPQQYGGAMDARYLKAAYHPSGDTFGDGGGGGGGGGGGAPSGGGGGGGGGGDTYSPVERTPRSERQSPYTGTTGGAGGELSRSAYDSMFKGTPLADQYDKVVAEAKKNNVPPSVMAAIMAHETGKGTSNMLKTKNNPAGLMDPKTGHQTAQSFATIGEGIESAGRTIGKQYGIAGGDIGKMGTKYAPVGAKNDPHGLNSGWAAGVNRYNTALAVPGTGGGGTGATGPMAETGRVPQNVMDQARALALQGGNSADVQAFMRSKGYPKAGAWCGEFTASVVKQGGGVPPRDAAVASNWLKWGTHVDPKDVQEGDVMVRTRSRYGGQAVPGQTGSHVALVGKVGATSVQRVGGNQRKGIVDQDRYSGEYEYRRGIKTQAPATAAAPAPEPAPEPAPSARAPAPDERAELPREHNVAVNLKVNDTHVQFARTTLRRQADREVREARWNSYSDIGAA
jgi:hypothetical protein